MKKTGFKILGGIIAGLVVVLVVVLCFQWNNIKALRYVARYTSQERESLLEEKKSKLDKYLEEFPDIHVQPLPQKAEAMYQKGELTTDEAMQIVKMEKSIEEIIEIKEKEQKSNSAKSQTDQATQTTQTKAQEEPREENRLQELLAQVYVLKAGFTGKLNGLIGEAQAELNSSAGKTRAMDIAQKYINLGSSLEAQCDEKMATLTDQIRSELKRLGRNTQLADEVQSVYQTEKSIKKASILDAYR